MRKRTNIIVRMSLWLVSAMIIIAAGSSLWFERSIVAESRVVMYEEAAIATHIISQSLTNFVEEHKPVTDEQLRAYILSIKPDSNLDISILDADSAYVVAPKADIATGSDALVVSNELPNTNWTVVYTYPRHLFTDYLRMMRWKMALGGMVAILLVLTSIVLIVRYVARPFVREQQHLIESQTSMERDLDIAAKIQQNFLPHDLSGIEALLLPARNIGGDLYDVIVQDDTCYFCVGDVSGKGIPASMFMASTIMLFRHAVRVEHLTSPAAIMQGINRTIARENKQCMFVTMVIGALHKDGTLTYCNAGHCSPIVAGAFLPPAACMPVGVFDEAEFVDESLTLSAGDSVFLYTDGVIEAMNESRECFGEARLLDLFAAAQPTMDQVLSAVRTYAGAAEQSDDITMLRINYVPESMLLSEAMPPDTLQFDHISSRFGSSAEIISAVLERAASLHAAVPESMRLIVEELVTNVARYAYPVGGDWGDNDHLWITVEYVDSAFVLTFRDRGVPFNPLAATAPDISLPAEERPIGGLGIFLVKQLATDIAYSYSNHTNILRITCPNK